MRLPLAAGSFWGWCSSNRRNLARSVLLIAKPAPLPPLIRDLPQRVAYRICTYVYCIQGTKIRLSNNKCVGGLSAGHFSISGGKGGGERQQILDLSKRIVIEKETTTVNFLTERSNLNV